MPNFTIGVQAEVAQANSRLESVEQKLDRIVETLAQGAPRAEKLNKSIQKLDRSVGSAGKEFGRFADQAERSMKKPRDEAERLNKTLGNLESRASSLASDFGLIGAAASAALGGAVAMALRQESAFASVEKTVDATAQQFVVLRKELLDLSEQIPVSFERLSEIGAIGGQLGIARENIVDFTNVIARLGEASNLVGEEGAVALARFINITDATQGEVENLASSIVQLGNTNATTEAEIANLATRIGLAGDTAGLSAADILGFSTALSSAGIRAELAGTNFSKFVTVMQTAVGEGAEELTNFARIAGMTAGQFQQLFREDATAAVLRFSEGLAQIPAEQISTELDGLNLKGTEMQRVMLALANNADQVAKAVGDSNVAWSENNALFEESEKRFQTAESQLNITKNVMLNTAAAAGQELTPELLMLNEAVRDLVGGLRDTDGTLTETSGKLVRFAAVLTGAVVAGAALAKLVAIGLSLSGVGTVILGVAAAVAGLVVWYDDIVAFGRGLMGLAFGFEDIEMKTPPAVEKVDTFAGSLREAAGETERQIGLFASLGEAAEAAANSLGVFGEGFGLRNIATGLFDIQFLVNSISDRSVEMDEAITQALDDRSVPPWLAEMRTEAERTRLAMERKKEVQKRIDEINRLLSRSTGEAADKQKELAKQAKEADKAFGAFLGNLRTFAKDIDEFSAETRDALGETLTEQLAANWQEMLERRFTALQEGNVKMVAEIDSAMRDVEVIVMDAAMRSAESFKPLHLDVPAANERAVLEMIADWNDFSQSIATLDRSFGVVEDALKRFGVKSKDQLAEIAMESEQAFNELAAAGVLGMEQLIDAEIQMLEARADAQRAAGQQLTREDQQRLAQLQRQQERFTRTSIDDWLEWSDELKGINSALAVNLVDGLFGGDVRGDIIRNAQTLLDALKAKLFSPLTDLISGFLNTSMRALIGGFASLAQGGGFGAGVGQALGGGGFLNTALGGLGSAAGGLGLGSLLGLGGGAAAATSTASFAGGFTTISGGSTAAGAGGGGLAGAFGGLGNSLVGLATNPIGIAILGAIGAGIGIETLFNKSTIEAFQDEFARDFGGVDIDKGFVKGLLERLGISKKDLEDIRKDIASSPITLLSGLTFAQEQGREQQFLGSLENVGNIFGEADLRGALEFGLQTNDFTALNQAFQDLFGQSTRLVELFGQDLEPLLIDMSEAGVTPLTEQIQALADAGKSSEEIFQQLLPVIVQQINAADELGVTLDPLITQFSDMAAEVEGLTDRQVALHFAFVQLEQAPAAAGEAIALLAEDIAFLEERGATAEQIVMLLGPALDEAAAAAEQFGLTLPDGVQALLDLGESAEVAAATLEDTLLASLETLRQQPAEAARSIDVLSESIDILLDAGASSDEILSLLGTDLETAAAAAAEFGIELPPMVTALLEMQRAAEQASEGVDGFADSAADAAQELSALQAGFVDFNNQLAGLAGTSENAAGQFIAAVVRMEGNGIDGSVALERAFERMGRSLLDSVNELLFFGDEIPEDLRIITDLLREVGLIEIDDQGFFALKQAAEEAQAAIEGVGDAVADDLTSDLSPEEQRAERDRQREQDRIANLVARDIAAEMLGPDGLQRVLGTNPQALNNLATNPLAQQVLGISIDQDELAAGIANFEQSIDGAGQAAQDSGQEASTAETAFDALKESLALSVAEAANASTTLDGTTTALESVRGSAVLTTDALNILANAIDGLADGVDGGEAATDPLPVRSRGNQAPVNTGPSPARSRSSIPQLNTGGTILETGLAVVDRGELVLPPGATVQGGGGSTKVDVQFKTNLTVVQREGEDGEALARRVSEIMNQEGDTFVREELIPRLETALERNTGGLKTAVKKAAGRTE